MIDRRSGWARGWRARGPRRATWRRSRMIAFSCAGCGKSFEVQDDLAGRRSRCKRCGAVMRIPAPEPVLAPLAPLATPVPAPEAVPGRRRKKARKPGTIDRHAWVALGVGSGLAAVALA